MAATSAGTQNPNEQVPDGRPVEYPVFGWMATPVVAWIVRSHAGCPACFTLLHLCQSLH